MKNLTSFFFAFCFYVFAFGQTSTPNIKGLYVFFNEEAYKHICFSLDIKDADMKDIATCKNADAAIFYISSKCNCELSPNEKIYIYRVAKETPPYNILKDAKVTKL